MVIKEYWGIKDEDDDPNNPKDATLKKKGLSRAYYDEVHGRVMEKLEISFS